jgi:hypothetical protein
VVLTDDVISCLFPCVSLHYILLFGVATELSLECFHIIGFYYFEFQNVLVDDAFVGFFVLEGV